MAIKRAEKKAVSTLAQPIVFRDKLLMGLVGVLVVASFMVGYLFGKVSVYEKLGSTGLGTGAPSAQQPTGGTAPEPITELSDDQWKQVVEGAAAQKGQKSAKVTVVEFTDYQCPFCGRFYTDTYGQLMKDYVDTGKVQYMLRDLPLSFHPNAKPGALAARCAGEQSKYWEMHDLLFENQDEWSSLQDTQEKFVEYAGKVSLNVGQFTSCYTSGKYDDAIEADATFANTVGANGTPTFYVNGKQLVGAQPYSAFQAAIDEALAAN